MSDQKAGQHPLYTLVKVENKFKDLLDQFRKHFSVSVSVSVN